MIEFKQRKLNSLLFIILRDCFFINMRLIFDIKL